MKRKHVFLCINTLGCINQATCSKCSVSKSKSYRNDLKFTSANADFQLEGFNDSKVPRAHCLYLTPLFFHGLFVKESYLADIDEGRNSKTVSKNI